MIFFAGICFWSSLACSAAGWIGAACLFLVVLIALRIWEQTL